MVRRIVVILLTVVTVGALNAQTVKEIKRQKSEVQAEIKETSKMLKSNKNETRKTLNRLKAKSTASKAKSTPSTTKSLAQTPNSPDCAATILPPSRKCAHTAATTTN